MRPHDAARRGATRRNIVRDMCATRCATPRDTSRHHRDTAATRLATCRDMLATRPRHGRDMV
eukprot:3508634-Prymnesium_polylepis.1